MNKYQFNVVRNGEFGVAPHIIYVISFNFKGYKRNFSVLNSPFANCQNFSIPAFKELLWQDRDFLIEAVKIAAHSVGKPLLIVDVEAGYVRLIKSIFPNIVLEAPYVSSNESKMCILIINVDDIKGGAL